MPLFGEASSPYDEVVEKVTAETLTSENWVLMMDICDRVGREGAKGAKQCLLSIKKRLNHRDPHVVLFALSLLDCLWNNSSALFRREVSSSEFISELSYRATNSNRVVGEKTRELIKKWAENECKKDASLSLIETLYKDLVYEGFTFESSDKPTKKAMPISNDPNVVSSEQEEADIAKAIALSLSDQPKQQSQYTPIQPLKQEPKQTDTVIRQVRALYDFEAVEENELSFASGDLINVFDASDQNWWRGQLVRGGKPGLFPASFITMDLSAQDDTASVVETVRNEPVMPKQAPRIDEAVLKRCIELLEQCDPTGETPDDPELAYFEQMSMAQIPLINQRLAQIDKQHNALAQVDVAIRDVLANYDDCVQQAQFNMVPQQPANFAPQQAPPNFVLQPTTSAPVQQQQAAFVQQPFNAIPPQ